jgi:flagellar L-ring protein precursor FlgH
LSHASLPSKAIHRSVLLTSTLVVLVGCALLEPQLTPVNRETFRTPQSVQSQAAPRYEGSLFTGENRRSLLFVDRKAHLVNDVVTIRIIEAANASGEATTATDRTSSVSGSLKSLFGYTPALSNGVNLSALEANLKTAFDGSGATSRKNSLSATITAVVREVFPNGNLYIEGVKEVIINSERQYIIISGVIRPEDIGPDNSILSSLIADAHVEYSGRGALADKQHPGWLGRIVDFVWPF